MKKRKLILIMLMMFISIFTVAVFIGKDMTATDDKITQVIFENKNITEESIDIHATAQCLEGYEVKAMQVDDQPKVDNVTELDFTATENRDYIVKVYYQSLTRQEELIETFTTTVDSIETQDNDTVALAEEPASTVETSDFVIDENGVITEYKGSQSITELVIPEQINGQIVTSIASNREHYGVFNNCSQLRSVTIPKSVTTIGYRAFYELDSLTSVMIPDSVTSIGDRAFEACELSSLVIPNSVTSIGDFAFVSCYNITSLIIPDSVKNVGSHAFASCHSLQTVVLGKSLVKISDYMFNKCESLTSVVFSDSLETIGDYAFEECSALKILKFPDSLISIGGEAFMGCDSLTSVTVPKSVKKIDWAAFADCTSLVSIIIPNSISELHQALFDLSPVNNLIIMCNDPLQSEIPIDSDILKINDLYKVNVYRVAMKHNIETNMNDIKYHEDISSSFSLDDIFEDKGVAPVIYRGKTGTDIYTKDDISFPENYFNQDEIVNNSMSYNLIGDKTSNDTKIENNQLIIGKNEKSTNLKLQLTGLNTIVELPIIMIPYQSVSIKKSPQNTYIEGEQYNPKGLILTLTYEDGYQEYITYDGNEEDFGFKYNKLDCTTRKQVITYKKLTVEQELIMNQKYLDKVLYNEEFNVEIKGKFTNNSYIIVEKIKDVDKELGKNLENKDIIGNYEVKVVGDYQGEIFIVFHVGEVHNNKNAYIRHLKQDGTIEKYEETVLGGKVGIRIHELSPFLICVNKEKLDIIPDIDEEISIPSIDDNKTNSPGEGEITETEDEIIVKQETIDSGINIIVSNDGIVLPGKDRILKTEDDVIVKFATQDNQGNIVILKGGFITYPDGRREEFPDGGILYAGLDGIYGTSDDLLIKNLKENKRNIDYLSKDNNNKSSYNVKTSDSEWILLWGFLGIVSMSTAIMSVKKRFSK